MSDLNRLQALSLISPHPFPAEEDVSLASPVANRPFWRWILLGVLLTFLANLRWGIGPLAWIAPGPFLFALRHNQRRYVRLTVGLAIVLAWVLALTKIVTAPLPWASALLFGIPIGAIMASGYLLWGMLHKRMNRGISILLFPALMVLVEWLQHTCTPFGSWGAAAYTQLEQPILLQSVSLFGIAGLGFMLYWFAALLEDRVSHRSFFKPQLIAFFTILIGLFVYGHWRLSAADQTSQKTVRLAAVSTDATFTPKKRPTQAQLQRYNKLLFERTRKAATAGAKLVVWNEGATLVKPQEESDWRRSLSTLAHSLHIYLVAAYIVPLAQTPFRYQNKALWFSPTGHLLQTYHKHRPVPGEPAVAGPAPARALHTSLGRISTAICYDFDFPLVGDAQAAQAPALVVLPSSDWLGIHPFHTAMAITRGIEGGYALLRSTRLGLSAGSDAHGRIHATQSWFDHTHRTMLVDLPIASLPTLYRKFGWLFPWACAFFALFALLHNSKAAPKQSTGAA